MNKPKEMKSRILELIQYEIDGLQKTIDDNNNNRPFVIIEKRFIDAERMIEKLQRHRTEFLEMVERDDAYRALKEMVKSKTEKK
jgi:hypothetical protein